jgi:hypothetical protein
LSGKEPYPGYAACCARWAEVRKTIKPYGQEEHLAWLAARPKGQIELMQEENKFLHERIAEFMEALADENHP